VSSDSGAHSLPTAETLVITQPNYVPWIGYFDLIDRAQLCIWYDDVQYTKNDWRNRNRIAAGDGVRWITVPVLTRGHFGQAIRDVAIDWRQDWAKKHLKSFEQEYARAPHFAAARELYASVLARRHALLADLTVELTEAIARFIGTRAAFALFDVAWAGGREASARPLHLRARRREGLPLRSGRPGLPRSAAVPRARHPPRVHRLRLQPLRSGSRAPRREPLDPGHSRVARSRGDRRAHATRAARRYGDLTPHNAAPP